MAPASPGSAKPHSLARYLGIEGSLRRAGLAGTLIHLLLAFLFILFALYLLRYLE